MVDVLSQNEIDALLAALSSGEMDADELKRKKLRRRSDLMTLNGLFAFLKIISVVLQGFMTISPAILQRTFQPNYAPSCRLMSFK